MIWLAGSVMASLDLVRSGHPVLEELAERTHETVNVGVAAGDAVVYLDQVSGTRSILSVNWVGRRTPLHSTSNGELLVAYMDDADRERLLAEPPERMTPRTVTDPDELRAQLKLVRSRGYAQTQGELEEGLTAVAAPIRKADGEVVAALSVPGPSVRMRAVDLPWIARLTIDAAAAVSHRLGFADRKRRSTARA